MYKNIQKPLSTQSHNNQRNKNNKSTLDIM